MLEKKGLKSVLIAGGSTLNTEFIRKKRVDEIILDVNPTILGEGIPLLAPAEFLRILSLLSANKINDDIVEMHYKVKK
jgi:riboflavin biosynthesis pyrimidine reductase